MPPTKQNRVSANDRAMAPINFVCSICLQTKSVAVPYCYDCRRVIDGLQDQSRQALTAEIRRAQINLLRLQAALA